MTLAAPAWEQLDHDVADDVASALADLGLTEPDVECDACVAPLCPCVTRTPGLQLDESHPAKWALRLRHPGRGVYRAGGEPAFLVVGTEPPRPTTLLLLCGPHTTLVKHPATQGRLHIGCAWCRAAVPIARHLCGAEKL